MLNRTAHRGIVVGVDGSAHSHVAVRWAAREAVMRHVALTIVHVLPIPLEGWTEWAYMPTELGPLQDKRGQQIIDEATRVAKDATTDGGHVQIDTEMYFSPAVSTMVVLTEDAQMVVVGCRGHGVLRRILLGSMSTALVQHAKCPVAVIHDEVVPALRAPVLVGIDGSPVSELATAIAFDEASSRGVDLVALHAWSDADVADMPAVNWLVVGPEAEETLAERLAGWEERYPDVRVRRRVVADGPARHLLKESESSQLVVVGSHGRGGFAGMLLGSVSTAVVHAARIPVIVARQG
ncbi:MAG: universal stress protein [Candidatus Sericytochromatia bacterium]